MTVNEALWDRVIRSVIGLVLLYLVFVQGAFTGGTKWVLAVIGAVLLITGVIGFCPGYRLLGIRTAK